MAGMDCERSEAINHKKSYCEACGWTGVVADTHCYVPDWDQRVDSQESGMFVCGECPECRCLAYQEKPTETYQINCKFEIHATFEVVAEDLDAAIKKLNNSALLSEYGLSDSTYGFDKYELEEMGIKLCKGYYADQYPAPTGREYTRRDWEYEVIEEDE